MSKATLKPVISKLREIIIKDIAGKMEKYGFDDAGQIVINKPLSEFDNVIKSNLVSLFKGKNIEGNKKEYISYIQDSARTFLHILICFKTMEQRGIMGTVIGRLMNDNIYDAVIPDFINVPPMAFSDLSEKFGTEISVMEKKDNSEEDREYYNFIYMLSALTKEMAKEVPLLFKDYEYNLVHPDFEGLKEILFNINKIDENEYSEDDFLGWIYQYWVDIKADELKFAKGEKDVSYANTIFYEILNNLEEEQTQFGEFYTPRWVVKYIVDNTLKPYFEDNKKIETIKLLDPACGAGNFLVYAFDVFYELYKIEHPDWPDNHIIGNILEKNIFGVDIQREPLQITAINLWLKAKRKAKDVSIKNLNLFNMNILKANSLYRWEKDQEEVIQLSLFQTEIELTEKKYSAEDIGQYISAQAFIAKKEARLFFKNKFGVIVMNPPFVDVRNMDKDTADFLKDEYPQNSRNLFSAFIERAIEISNKKGYIGFISSDTFTYISSFEKTRELILENTEIKTILSLGEDVFEGPTVDSLISILRKNINKNNRVFAMNISKIILNEEKHSEIIENVVRNLGNKRYLVEQSKFKKIKSNPFLYDISDHIRDIFTKSQYLGVSETSPAKVKQGMATGENEKFLRKKWEIPQKIIGTSFLPYSKGGGYCKYANDTFDYIDWRSDAKNYYNTSPKARKNYLSSYFSSGDVSMYLKEGISYNLIDRYSRFSARKLESGHIFDVASSSLFTDENIDYMLGFLNSKFTNYILKKLNASVNFQVGDLQRIPYMKPSEELEKLVSEKTIRAVQIKEYMLGFNYVSDFYHAVELRYGFDSGADSIKEAYEIYKSRYKELLDELENLQLEIDQIIYSVYELCEEDIGTIENDITHRMSKASDDIDIKKATLNYLRAILKDYLILQTPRIYTDEEISRIIEKRVDDIFGKDSGYKIIEEAEAILEKPIINVIRGGLKINSTTINFCGLSNNDNEEPYLQQRILSGSGSNKHIVIWHLSHFLLEFEEDKKYVMQNEIRRLSNEVYRPRLQTIKEKLQGSVSGAEKKELEKQEKLLSEAVKTLEAWKVVN